MTGYDLDGIFLSDMWGANAMPITDFLTMRRNNPHAIFVPKGVYHVVTGRPVSDIDYTQDWLNQNMSSNLPAVVWHGNTDLSNAVVYKAKVINAMGFDRYFESDPHQAALLTQACPSTKIIHFATWLSDRIAE